MYLDKSYSVKGKTYKRALLRTSYRDKDGKIKHTTVANLKDASPEEIEAIEIALKLKDKIALLEEAAIGDGLHQGKSIGAVWVLYHLAKELGVVSALGKIRESKLVLWMIFTRIMYQCSKRSACKYTKLHHVAEVLGLEEDLHTDHLYDAMDWLDEHQAQIEKKLFRAKQSPSTVYLYDVSSSYLEGQQNELAAWGYNRDKKKGKKQIVYGLLTDSEGDPLAIRVFPGNTNDHNTVEDILATLSGQFNIEKVVFVGDKGMVKSQQIEQLEQIGYRYITSIGKAQIRTLINKGVFDLTLFDDDLCEVEHEGLRYILRCNPVRKQEMTDNRMDRIEAARSFVDKQNSYLQEHPKAKDETALKRVNQKITRLKLGKILSVGLNQRTLSVELDQEALQRAQDLDGCYVIKTDLRTDELEAQSVHDRYKDLALVESAFRDIKTGFLELRPVNHRLAARTRAHAFIVMLAYKIERKLRVHAQNADMTLAELVQHLLQIKTTIKIVNKVSLVTTPKADNEIQAVLDDMGVALPAILPARGKVATK